MKQDSIESFWMGTMLIVSIFCLLFAFMCLVKADMYERMYNKYKAEDVLTNLRDWEYCIDRRCRLSHYHRRK